MYFQDADLTLSPPGDPLTVLGKFSIVAMGNKVAVQTGQIWAVGASSYISNGTYPEGSVIPIVVTFSVEVNFPLNARQLFNCKTRFTLLLYICRLP